MELYPAHFAERLVSGMSDAIVYADAEGVIRVWNRTGTRSIRRGSGHGTSERWFG